MEIVEDGLVATMGGCWASSTNIPLCYCRLHEINMDGNCEAIDPEYQARLTELPTPLSRGCKAAIRKRTAPLADWDDYGQVVEVVPGISFPD